MTGRLLTIGFAAIVLLGGAYAAWHLRSERLLHESKEQALRETVVQMRRAIAKFKEDKGRYPHSLEELVPAYLRRIPRDPITRSDKTWRVDTEETVAVSGDFTTAEAAKPQSYVVDVHSGAPKPYSDY